jgi:hypothetical protein
MRAQHNLGMASPQLMLVLPAKSSVNQKKFSPGNILSA